jgi:hypothetical protein
VSCALARRRGIVVIASTSRTEDPGFESRQGLRFLGFLIHRSAVVKTLHAMSMCEFEKNKCFKNIFKNFIELLIYIDNF